MYNVVIYLTLEAAASTATEAAQITAIYARYSHPPTHTQL